MPPAPVSIAERFRLARERAGLSMAEVAARADVSEPCVCDLEGFNDELMTAYSAADLQRFAAVLSVAPWELLGTEDGDAPISAGDLGAAVREHCRARGMTLDDFGDAAGWDVSKAADEPQLLLTDFSLDGIRDICREVGVDWQRFIRGLSTSA
jgi:transcriptional regulator with XRE-family HTH domain